MAGKAVWLVWLTLELVDFTQSACRKAVSLSKPATLGVTKQPPVQALSGPMLLNLSIQMRAAVSNMAVSLAQHILGVISSLPAYERGFKMCGADCGTMISNVFYNTNPGPKFE